MATYKSDQEHDSEQTALQSTLNTSLQRQEYMRDQLDGIGVMISKVGEKSPDPAVGQLAGAIAKMADSAKAASVIPSSDLHLRVLYEGVGLDNRTIAVCTLRSGSRPYGSGRCETPR